MINRKRMVWCALLALGLFVVAVVSQNTLALQGPLPPPEAESPDCHYTLHNFEFGGHVVMLDECTGRTWKFVPAQEGVTNEPVWFRMNHVGPPPQ